MNNTEKKTEDWYKAYYEKMGNNRNDLLFNPEVLYQSLAFEDSVIKTLQRATGLSRENSRILDVGCGSGGSLARFIHLGFNPKILYGIDLIPQRIEEGKVKHPNINLICDDATSMKLQSSHFDLVLASTMFVQIIDSSVSELIASEMLRVTNSGGYILIVDWRYNKPGNNQYLAVSNKRIKQLFCVGDKTDIVCQNNGALIPPIGRRLSRYLPSLYFLIRTLLPFLVGSKATLLKKR